MSGTSQNSTVKRVALESKGATTGKTAGSNDFDDGDLDYVALATPSLRRQVALKNSQVSIQTSETKTDEKEVPKSLASDLVLSKILTKMGSGKGLKNVNRTMTFIMTEAVDYKADSGGKVIASRRFGLPSQWTSIATFQAVFQRFRVVGVEYFIIPMVENGGSVSVYTPQAGVAYLDTASTAVTLGSVSSGFAAPGSQLFSIGLVNTNMASKKLLPVYRAKVRPEQDWFDLSAESQKGCLAFYTYGATGSANAWSLYARYRVQFSGLLL